MLFKFELSERPVESFLFLAMRMGFGFRRPQCEAFGAPIVLLAMHGYIETFSMMPQRLYRWFDAPVGFGPFSSRLSRTARTVCSVAYCARGELYSRWLSGVGELIGDLVKDCFAFPDFYIAAGAWMRSASWKLGRSQCTSHAEVVLMQTSTVDAPVYIAWKCSSWVDDVQGGLSANVERECSVFSVDVDRGRRFPRSSLLTLSCGSRNWCLLEKYALEVDGRIWPRGCYCLTTVGGPLH
ncbi:hypothetical protein CRG98_005068 [Punica granatum]|uniref:Uncharacterized protein n=1 Tax=Punica granatum TaxID=22663 RepID=A0A2I0L301_PUNGR|nr:hypothetical protein CRG98_005068 [Punica granatum]